MTDKTKTTVDELEKMDGLAAARAALLNALRLCYANPAPDPEEALSEAMAWAGYALGALHRPGTPQRPRGQESQSSKQEIPTGVQLVSADADAETLTKQIAIRASGVAGAVSKGSPWLQDEPPGQK